MSGFIISYLNAAGAAQAVRPAFPLPVTLVSLPNPLPVAEAAYAYEPCPVSATTTLGGAGAIGDVLAFVTVYPTTTAPGNVIIRDNGVAIATFPGGAASVSNLVPFILPVYAASQAGAWSIVCGANVSAMASGRFT